MFSLEIKKRIQRKKSIYFSFFVSSKKEEMVVIFVLSNLRKSSKSLSPVRRKSALPSLDNSNKKLSLGSLQTSIVL